MTTEKDFRGTWTVLRSSFDDAVAKLPEALQAEGFGVITQIDMQATLKAKIGVDFRRYRIFGACNPKFAHEALQGDAHVGLLLPCNVVLYENDEKKAVLGVIDPVLQLGADHDARFAPLAKEIGDRLTRAAAALDA